MGRKNTVNSKELYGPGNGILNEENSIIGEFKSKSDSVLLLLDLTKMMRVQKIRTFKTFQKNTYHVVL